MNVTTIILIFTLLFNALIVYLVYKSNPKRFSNRIFSYLGVNISVWNLIFLFIINANTPEGAGLWIRISFILGSFVPLNLLALVMSIGEKQISFLQKNNFLIMAVLSAGCFVLGFSPSLFTSITQPGRSMQQVPHATYGWAFYVYFILFLTVAFYAFGILFKKLKTKKGLARAEVQYILLGCFLGLTFVIFCNFLFPIVFKSAFLVQFSPVGVLIMNSFIGYGIAKYKILDVSVLMRRVLSYSFVILFIFLLYNVSRVILDWFLSPYLTPESPLVETLALLIVIFAFEPSRRKINEFVNFRIFKMEYSTENLLAGMEKVLYTVGDVKIFLERCLRIVLESAGISSGRVYFIMQGEEKLYFSISQSLKETDDVREDVYPSNLQKFFVRRQVPLIKGEIERMIPTDENMELIREMEGIKAEMAIPLLSEQKLFGILCFGEKVSGRFYSPQDEEIFERLSYYLSLKVQNFLFYEQIERAKIYQETLLEHLPIGVIGIDAKGDVTVVNKEAERITGLDGKQIEQSHFSEVLPEEFIKIFSYSIENRKDMRHLQFEINKGDRGISLDANSSVFSDREGTLAGVQIIFADVTHIKELEEGIKRAERLSSLGIMAAGIAHEVKNPLVSIQTFANLLPERYNDREFREKFSVLTIKEVERINTLVEQILVFAKPKSSLLKEINLVDVLKATVIILSAQFPDKKIEIKEDYCSDRIIFEGDEDTLKQAFLNIFINSAQSLDTKGVINVKIDRDKELATVQIQDNGCGIKQEVISKIFEPFFTTKEKGTGLGLAIVSRIIDEHGGTVKIESVEGRGTTVTVEMPLHKSRDKLNELRTLDN